MSQISDGESDAWARALNRDPEAFAAIFDLHRDRVFRHALRLVQSTPQAEDVTGMAFFELWRSRDRVRVVEGSVIAWLLVCTTNVARNLQRSERRYRAFLARLPPPQSAADHSGEVDEAMDALPQRERVAIAFSRLNNRDQEILALCVLEELSVSQASAALRIPLATAKSRLARAKGRLLSATTSQEAGA